MTTLSEAAGHYAAQGISVFPLKPRSKEPLTPAGFKDASNRADQVLAWWKRQPASNIGIATGAPAGFWVLDVDGPEAEAALTALQVTHGALPDTVQQRTGRGRHLCFLWEPEGPEMRNRSKVGGVPIDVRGNGGYIVAPPSVHPGDPKTGVAPGRVYAWDAGRGPGEVAFARAPAWLVEICMPSDQRAAAEARPIAPRAMPEGRATRYGEVVLDACVAAIVAAKKGSRDSTLYKFACKAAGLCPSGHIDRGYLQGELLRAGRVHVPDAMSEKQLERQVERALAWGEAHAWGPAADRSRPAVRHDRRETPMGEAIARADAVSLFEGAPAADRELVHRWLQMQGLQPAGVPSALQRLRLMSTPAGPGLVMGLQTGPDAPIDGAAVYALPAMGRVGAVRGLHDGRVGILAWPDGADQLLIATNLVDAWALAEAAFESGDPMAVVVAPRLSTFAGVPLGDKWGRVSPETPTADPERLAWTCGGIRTAYLAVRRDLVSPEVRARKPLGGTRKVRLTGDAAARFWGGLASAAWRSAGAAPRVLSPPAGCAGFNDLYGVA